MPDTSWRVVFIRNVSASLQHFNHIRTVTFSCISEVLSIISTDTFEDIQVLIRVSCRDTSIGAPHVYTEKE